MKKIIMIFKKLIFASILLTMCFVSAQNKKIQFGVKGGLNRSAGFVNDAHEIKFKSGYHIGVFVDYTLYSKFGIQTGLFLSEKGGKFVGLHSGGYDGGTPDYRHRFKALYLQTPLMVTYKQNISEKWSVNFGVGTYFAYGVSGKARIDINGVYSDGTNFREWNTFANSEEYVNESFVRFDIGILFNFEVEFNNIFLGIGIEKGFVNTLRQYSKDYGQDLTLYNYNVPFSIGYRF